MLKDEQKAGILIKIYINIDRLEKIDFPMLDFLRPINFQSKSISKFEKIGILNFLVIVYGFLLGILIRKY